MKYDIFISYRRDGGDTLSQLIYDRLTHRGYRVFLDIESLNAGKFNEKLLEVIEECNDMVIILPPKALDRCKNEGDWLYRELEHGIKNKKNIVPVMMNGFEWPDEIPEAIADIQNFNGIKDNKEYFDAAIDKLTTLLISKPARGGKAFQKIGERSKLLQGKVKRRKRVILGVALAAVVCVAGVFGMKYIEKQRRIKEESNVTITLTPSEEMNTADYYDAIEILEERFNVLADNEKYSFKEEKGEIKISIPESVFNAVDITQVMRCYVTRPIEIYLAKHIYLGDKDQEAFYFHIDRSEIESVELVEDAPVEIDFSDYKLQGVESEEECKYFAVELESSAAEEAKEWLSQYSEEEVALYQDRQEYGIEAYYYKIAGIDGNTLYFVDNFQYSNYLELIKYNYENETFTKPFTFNIKLPVSWEYENGETSIFGENQCDITKLPEKTIARYDYETYNPEFTDGEYQDLISMFKKRLDALGTPYAFGYTSGDMYKISIAIDPAYMNYLVYTYLGNSYGLEIKSNFYDVISEWNMEEMKVEEQSDGTYGLVIVPNDNWFNNDVPIEKETIHLCLSSSEISLDERTLEEAFDGECFVFDSLSKLNVEKVTGKEKHMLEFLKAVHETDLPGIYSLKAAHSDVDLANVEMVIGDPTFPNEIKAQYEEVLDSLGISKEQYEVSSSVMGESIQVKIGCPKKESWIPYANEMYEEIYEKCDMKSGNIPSISVYFYEELKTGKYIEFSLTTSEDAHALQIRPWYGYEMTDSQKDVFEKVFNEKEFYRQFSVASLYVKEDGVISFK